MVGKTQSDKKTQASLKKEEKGLSTFGAGMERNYRNAQKFSFVSAL